MTNYNHHRRSKIKQLFYSEKVSDSFLQKVKQTRHQFVFQGCRYHNTLPEEIKCSAFSDSTSSTALSLAVFLTHSLTPSLIHSPAYSITQSHTHSCGAQIKHSRRVWMRGEEKWHWVITVKHYQSLLCAVTRRWETRLRVIRIHDCLPPANARLILLLLPPLISFLFLLLLQEPQLMSQLWWICSFLPESWTAEWIHYICRLTLTGMKIALPAEAMLLLQIKPEK